MAKKPKVPGIILDYTTPVLEERQKRFQNEQRLNQQKEQMQRFVDRFDTPEKKQMFFNYRAGKAIEKRTGSNPYREVGDMQSVFNEDAQSLQEPEPIEGEDPSTPEDDMWRDLHNTLVKYKGGLPESNFMDRAFVRSMTGSWLKWAKSPVLDIKNRIAITETGVDLDGNELNLNPEEHDLISRWAMRTSGDDRDKSFFEKMAETSVSLVFDTPLLMISGKLATKTMSAFKTGRYLLQAPGFMPRVTGRVLQQSLNFNILGIPQTVESTKKEGVGGFADQFYHNVKLGSLAGGGGVFGQKLMKGVAATGVIKGLLTRNPALREEMAGLGSSFGFGYVSAKLEGQENIDALAQGLAFAATHFTNPTAYRRVLDAQRNKGVRIRQNASELGDRYGSQEYFLEKSDGKYYKIDTQAFKDKGDITVTAKEGIVATEKMAENYPLYNEVRDAEGLKWQAFKNNEKTHKQVSALVKKWKDELNLTDKEVKKYQMDLYTAADIITTSGNAEKWVEASKKTMLPDDATLNDMIVTLANENNIPYTKIKSIIASVAYGTRYGGEKGDILQEILNEAEWIKTKEQYDQARQDYEPLAKGIEKAANKATELRGLQLKSNLVAEVLNNRKEPFQEFEKESFGYKDLIKEKEELTEQTNQIKKELGLDKKMTPSEVFRMAKMPTKAERFKILKEELDKPQIVPAKERFAEFEKEEKEPGKVPDVKELAQRGKRFEEFAYEIEDAIKDVENQDKRIEEVKQKFDDVKNKDKIAEDIRVEMRKEGASIEQYIKDTKTKESIEEDVNVAKRKKGAKVEKEIETAKAKEDILKQVEESIIPEETSRSQIERIKIKKEKGLKSEKAIDIKRKSPVEKKIDTLLEEEGKRIVSPRVQQFRQNVDKQFAEAEKEFKGDQDKIDHKKRNILTGEQGAPHIENIGKAESEKISKEEIKQIEQETQDILKSMEEARAAQRRLEAQPDKLADAASKAIDNIKKNQNLTMNIDPTLLKDYATVGAYQARELLTRGVEVAKQFTQWSKDMVKRLGESVKPFLKDIWNNVKAYATGEKAIGEPGALGAGLGGIGEGGKKGPRGTQQKRVDTSYEGSPKSKNNKGFIEDSYSKETSKEIRDNIIIEENKTRGSSDNEVNKPINMRYADRNNKTKSDMILEDLEKVNSIGILEPAEKMSNIVTNWTKHPLKTIKNYAKYNIPAAQYANISKKFKPLRELGESMLRNTSEQVNRILRNHEYWNKGHKFNALTKPQQAGYLDMWKKYHNGRSAGTIDKDMTWNEIAEWANLDGQQRDVLTAQKKSVQASLDIEKQGLRMTLVDRSNNIIEGMTDAQLEKLSRVYEKTGEISQPEMDEITKQLNADLDLQEAAGVLTPKERPKEYKKILRERLQDYINKPEGIDLKEEAAEILVDAKYKDIYDKAYYNTVRPTSPKTWIIKGVKKDRTYPQSDVEPQPFERYYGYAYSKSEAMNQVAELNRLGYEVDAPFRVADLIKEQRYQDVLTDSQLFELANRGDIPFEDATLQKLADATKFGFSQHLIGREYVPGMRFDKDEFKLQFGRGVRDAVYSANKPYFYSKMNDYMQEWQNEYNQKVESGISGSELADLKGDLKYGQGYVNQLRQPENSVLDGMRFGAMTWHVGFIKPGFLVQQLMQSSQTGIPVLISNAKKLGLTSGDAIKAFHNSYGNALKYSLALSRMKETGMSAQETVDSFKNLNLDVKKLEMFETQEYRQKVSAIGTSEWYNTPMELDYEMQTGGEKFWDSMKKGVSILGRGVEKMSRMQMADALYEVAKKGQMKGETLEDHVSTGLDLTMSQFGKGGRPPLLYDKKGNVVNNQFIHGLRKNIMTYQTFKFNNFGQYADLIHNKQYSSLYAKFAISAGLHGLVGYPLMQSMFMLADAFTDEPMDYQMFKLSDELDKTLPGDKGGQVITRGLSTLVGSDMSRMFSEDTPLITDVYGAAWGDSWRDKAVNIIIGAPGAFTSDMMNGSIDLIDSTVDIVLGNNPAGKADEKALKALRKMSPVMLKNILTTMDFKKDGIQVRGKSVVVREDITVQDLWLKVASFPVYKQQRAYLEMKFGPEAELNKNKRLFKGANEHIREIRRNPNLSEEAKKNEIEHMMKLRDEYRQIVKDLAPEVKAILRKRNESDKKKRLEELQEVE